MLSQNKIKKQVEKVFLNSNNPEKLFDAFHLAYKHSINEPELYKILLANPALSLDEIKLYSQKIIDKFPEHAYNYSIWTAEILESNSGNPEYLEEALNFYRNAIKIDCTKDTPLLKLLQNYNYSIPYSLNETIIEIVNHTLPKIKFRKKLYSQLAKHYQKEGNKQLSRKFKMLAEKSDTNK